MKFNKWTVGLAAIGVVSLASAARADEKMSQVQTALSNTTISGYVSASFNWNIYPGAQKTMDSPVMGIPFQNQEGSGQHRADYLSKQDGFNLDVVKLSIAKAQDESPWASGYQVDLLFGPDAVGYNSSANANQFHSTSSGNPFNWIGSGGSDFAIKQAYVVLRTPVGNGIDWKIGVFDSPLGYESFDAGNNPNYTRSWGYAIEPTELTGLLATYKIVDELSISAGIANTLEAGINARATTYGEGANNTEYWNKAFMGSATFTGPSSWGWAAGSSIYAGIIYGFNGQNGGNNGYHQGGDQINYYAGATFNTPCKQLTVGMAFDYAHNLNGGSEYTTYYVENNALVAGLYATFKATDKLSISARGEYVYEEQNTVYPSASHTGNADGFELTGTVEYDLWANVISRLEVRWDHASHHDYMPIAGETDYGTAVGFYANVIYKF